MTSTPAITGVSVGSAEAELDDLIKADPRVRDAMKAWDAAVNLGLPADVVARVEARLCRVIAAVEQELLSAAH